MDALSGFLDGPRARGAFLQRSVFDPPWALRIEDEAPLTVVAMATGDAWIVPESAQAQRLSSGDVAIICGPAPYAMADDPETVPTVVIHPGQRCTTPDGESLTEAMSLGVRTWGTSTTGSVTMVTGTYQTDGEISRMLLDALPTLIVVRSDAWSSPVIPLLAAEVLTDEPGQEAVLDRLLDLLLVTTLRASFAQPDADVPAWYRANGDPVVGPALRQMQTEPARQWTVATLAAGAGVSRAALARRFHQMVGAPPMSFLAGWRLALAADLLLETDAAVGAVARDVGYGSPFTFSTAFKRVYGVSPRTYRDRETGTRPAPNRRPGTLRP